MYKLNIGYAWSGQLYCDYIHVFKYLTSKCRSCIAKIMWVIIQICFKQFNQTIASYMSHDVHMNYKLLFYQTLLQWWWIILGACCQKWVKNLLFQKLVCDQCDDKIKWSFKHEIVCWSIFIMLKFFVLGFWFLKFLLQLLDVGDCLA